MTTIDQSVTGRFWSFSHKGGSVVTESVRFAADGRIVGDNQENEDRWCFEDGVLCFLSRDRRKNTRPTDTRAVGDGWSLEGRVILYDIDLTLCLISQPCDFSPMPRALARNALAASIKRWSWSIGDYTYGIPDIVDAEMGQLVRGKFCSIAAGATIVLGNHNPEFASIFAFSSLGREWSGVPAGVSDHVGKGNNADRKRCLDWEERIHNAGADGGGRSCDWQCDSCDEKRAALCHCSSQPSLDRRL